MPLTSMLSRRTEIVGASMGLEKAVCGRPKKQIFSAPGLTSNRLEEIHSHYN